MIFSSIIAGLYRSWGIKRIILLFILLSLLVSSLVLNPYINTFQQFFSHRLAAEVLAQKNIYTYYLEFSRYLAPAVEAARSVISLGAFLFLIISVLLSGGVIDGLISLEPVRLRKFWSRSGHFFGRMSRLLILSSVILALALLLGILLLCFPLGIAAWLGVPEGGSNFYPIILGAVLFGIGVWFRRHGRKKNIQMMFQKS